MVFYGPHGKSLVDPGLGNILRNEVEHFEKLEPGSRVRNYALFKYSRDDYASVRFGVDRESVDVMTVRNRKKFDLFIANSTLSLKDAFGELAKNNLVYEEIHFVSCRHFSLNMMPPSHTASKRIAPVKRGG